MDCKKGMRTLVWAAVGLLAAACANMGRPEGGERDYEPPKFVRSNPMPGATRVSPTRLTAYFDENIQLEDAFNKVIVSPAQKQPPAVSANGRRLTVDFRDTLRPNTTYTIDFADAIKDLNEGNILDGFALDFSTGDSIDSLRISGMVLQAENLEPAQGMLVGVYSNLSDTAITTLPLDRIARTSQTGHFTIRNLKPGTYRIFALNDLNRDYHWDRSEDIAFYDTLIVPSVERITVTDTLYASDGEDSIVTRPGQLFLPNDILLSWFNTGYKAHYLSDHKRQERRRVTLTFAAPNDSMPRVTIVDGAPGPGRDASEWARIKANPTLDSLEYWLEDPEVLAADSLRLAVGYLKTDTSDQLVWTSDTLRFFFREPGKKKNDKKKKEEEDSTPKFIVDSVTGDTTFLPPPDMEYLSVRALGGSQQELNRPLLIEADVPLSGIDSTGWRLEIAVDTLWEPVGGLHLMPDSSNLIQRRRLDVPWTPGAKYRLTIDTLAATSIYGTWNRPYRSEFTVKNPEDYANLRFRLPGTDTVQAVVELLNSSDAPVYRAIKPAGEAEVDIRFIAPGTYYARLFIDSNPNGKWDTGNPLDSLQPEEVYYFSKKLDLKRNWDIEQIWNIDELPVDIQKPYAIKKNKPKLKRGETAPEEDTDEESDIYDENYNPFDRTGRNSRGERSYSPGQGNSSGGVRRGGMRRSTF